MKDLKSPDFQMQPSLAFCGAEPRGRLDGPYMIEECCEPFPSLLPCLDADLNSASFNRRVLGVDDRLDVASGLEDFGWVRGIVHVDDHLEVRQPWPVPSPRSLLFPCEI